MAQAAEIKPEKSKAPQKVKEHREGVPSLADPWRSMTSFRDEMNRMFDDFFVGAPRFGRSLADWPSFEPAPRFAFKTPQIDVAESDDHYEITAELPGIDEKDIHLELKEGMMVLKGEKREEKEEKKKDYHLTERHFGSFHRSFRLPEEVDEDKISAEFKNGVLTVKLPKGEKAKESGKKIEVKAA